MNSIPCILAHGGWREEGQCQGICGAAFKSITKHCDQPEPSYRLVNGVTQLTGAKCSCNATDSTETFCDGFTATIYKSCNDELCKYLNYCMFRIPLYL